MQNLLKKRIYVEMVKFKVFLQVSLLVVTSLTPVHSTELDEKSDKKTSPRINIVNRDTRSNSLSSPEKEGGEPLKFSTPPGLNFSKEIINTSPLQKLDLKNNTLATSPIDWENFHWDHDFSDSIIDSAKKGSIPNQRLIIQARALDIINEKDTPETYKSVAMTTWPNIDEMINQNNSLYILGLSYFNKDILENKYSQQVLSFINAAPLNKKDPLYLYTLGRIYEIGIYVKKNSVTSKDYSFKASDLGLTIAKIVFGEDLYSNKDMFLQKPCGLLAIKDAAETGNPRAQYIFGKLSYTGDTIKNVTYNMGIQKTTTKQILEINKKLSFENLMKSAMAGYIPAKHFILDKFFSMNDSLEKGNIPLDDNGLSSRKKLIMKHIESFQKQFLDIKINLLTVTLPTEHSNYIPQWSEHDTIIGQITQWPSFAQKLDEKINEIDKVNISFNLKDSHLIDSYKKERDFYDDLMTNFHIGEDKHKEGGKLYEDIDSFLKIIKENLNDTFYKAIFYNFKNYDMSNVHSLKFSEEAEKLEKEISFSSKLKEIVDKLGEIEELKNNCPNEIDIPQSPSKEIFTISKEELTKRKKLLELIRKRELETMEREIEITTKFEEIEEKVKQIQEIKSDFPNELDKIKKFIEESFKLQTSKEDPIERRKRLEREVKVYTILSKTEIFKDQALKDLENLSNSVKDYLSQVVPYEAKETLKIFFSK